MPVAPPARTSPIGKSGGFMEQPWYKEFQAKYYPGPTGVPGPTGQPGGLPPMLPPEQAEQIRQAALERERLGEPAPPPEVKPGPAPTIDIEAREFNVGEGWTVAERDAQGDISVYVDAEGIRHYTPEHTMWHMGYETLEEYKRYPGMVMATGKKAEGYGLGRVPYTHDPETGAEIAYAPHVAVKTWDGRDIHLTRKEYDQIARLGGQQQFMEMQFFGLIEPDAIYDPNAFKTFAKKTAQYQAAKKLLAPYIDAKTGDINIIAAVATGNKKVRQALFDIGFEVYSIGKGRKTHLK